MRIVRVFTLVALMALALTVPEPVSARRALTLVDDAYSPAAANDNTITLANVQAGDLVAVIAGIANTSNTLTISDSGKHTWNGCPVGDVTNTGETGMLGQARYTVATGAITTITLTSSATAGTFGGAVVYRGSGTVSCDGSDVDEQDATTAHGGNISVAPSTANDTLLFGALVGEIAFAVSVPPSGYTEVGTTLAFFWAGYKTVNATSANTLTFTTSASEDTLSVLMALTFTPAASNTCRGILTGVGC